MQEEFVYVMTVGHKSPIFTYIEEHPRDVARLIPTTDGRYAIHMRAGEHLFVTYSDRKPTHRASRAPRRSADHLQIDFVSVVHVDDAARSPYGVFYPPLPDDTGE